MSKKVLGLATLIGCVLAASFFYWQQKNQVSFHLDPACRARYKKLYAEEELKVTVVFGYKDARPQRFVGDRYERAALVLRALTACTAPQGGFCGFARDPEDGHVFLKTIPTPWGPKSVRLQIMDSSVGPDDQDNRQNPFQEWKSQRTKQVFLEALTDSHVVLYNGHSRAGGGPDFLPPLINSLGRVLYADYRQAQRGFMSMLQVLGREHLRARSQVLGLFSCKSSQLFEEQLRKSRPDLALIGSESLIYFKDALENTAATLDSLLRLKCQESFEEALKQRDPLKGSQLVNFFD